MPITATVMPLKDAVEQISQRQAVGTRLSSAEMDVVPAEIRLRTMWAARLEEEQRVASMQAKITQFIALERTKLEGGGEGVFMDRGLFMEKMRAEFKKAGYRPDPKKKGTLQDFTSSGRLGLIWDMNLAQAQGFAHWTSGQSAVSLRMWPAMEFVRLESRVERRLWNVKWKALGGTFYPGASDYPEGRMIALKNDPIWKLLNRFGVPWKPFDWGSGMGTKNIGRREALALGVVKEDDAPQEPEKVPFNENAQASVKALPLVSRERMRSEFGDAVRFDKDTIFLQRDTTEANEYRKADIREELRARAFEIAERGRAEIRRLRSEDDAASWTPGFDSALSEPEILASTSAVAVGRKLLYHEQWTSDEEALVLAGVLRKILPENVAVAAKNGHVHAWRPDLLELTLDELQEISEGGDNGYLLGYGQDLFVDPFALVSFQNAEGKVIGGFQAPARHARSYAMARARDFADAIGAMPRILINLQEVKP